MIKRKFGNTGFEITPVVYGGIVSKMVRMLLTNMYHGPLIVASTILMLLQPMKMHRKS